MPSKIVLLSKLLTLVRKIAIVGTIDILWVRWYVDDRLKFEKVKIYHYILSWTEKKNVKLKCDFIYDWKTNSHIHTEFQKFLQQLNNLLLRNTDTNSQVQVTFYRVSKIDTFHFVRALKEFIDWLFQNYFCNVIGYLSQKYRTVFNSYKRKQSGIICWIFFPKS